MTINDTHDRLLGEEWFYCKDCRVYVPPPHSGSECVHFIDSRVRYLEKQITEWKETRERVVNRKEEAHA